MNLAEVDLLQTIMKGLVDFVTLGGGIVLLFGGITLGGGLKDKTGPQIQSGIWQLVGGGVIIAAAQLFSTLIK